MDIDPVSLILAKTPNLERLARALRAPLPPQGPGYERELRRVVARALDADRLRAAAEERREMDRKQAASEIADQLGEHGNPGQAPRARVEAQIRKMLRLMGEAWVRSIVVVVDHGSHCSGERADGTQRTRGGVFFEVARKCGGASVQLGNITSRAFYSTFCWREPKPSEPKPAPISKRAIPRPPATPQHRHAPKRKPRPEPEVYVRRR